MTLYQGIFKKAKELKGLRQENLSSHFAYSFEIVAKSLTGKVLVDIQIGGPELLSIDKIQQSGEIKVKQLMNKKGDSVKLMALAKKLKEIGEITFNQLVADAEKQQPQGLITGTQGNGLNPDQLAV